MIGVLDMGRVNLLPVLCVVVSYPYPYATTADFSIVKNKRHFGLIAPPFKISFLATEYLPKMKLKSVLILLKIIHPASSCHIWSLFTLNHTLTKSKSSSIANQFKHFSISQIYIASRKIYLVIILPNSYQTLSKSKIRSSWSRFEHCSKSLL